MALIHCPECGQEISDQAEVCIHCGYPLKKKREESAQAQQDILTESSNIPFQATSNVTSIPIQSSSPRLNTPIPKLKKLGKKEKIIITACTVAVIVVIVLIMGSIGKTKSVTKTADISSAPTSTPVPTTAPLSYEELLKNVQDDCEAGQYEAASIEIKQNKSNLSDSELEGCITEIGKYESVEWAGEEISQNLKSPRSYHLYSYDATTPLKSSRGVNMYSIILDIKYGGTNSFGAEITKTAMLTSYFTIDTENCTVDKSDILIATLGE